jgi:5'-3' exonuclease
MTPDKDLGQCIRSDHVVQVDRMRNKVTGEAELLATRGVLPESIPDYLALVGDTADGIPGIKGFGEKTAAALLREYLHVESIPARGRDWKPSVRGAMTLAPLLAASRDDVLLYRKLATLVTDVPLAETLDDLRWRGAPRKAYEAWCDALAVSESMRTRPPRFES